MLQNSQIKFKNGTEKNNTVNYLIKLSLTKKNTISN